MSQSTDVTSSPLEPNSPGAAALAAELTALVHLPGSPQYSAARTAWNLTVDQRPGAVAVPGSAADVVAIVSAAARLGVRISTQATGHAAGALARQSLHDVVLMRTHLMRGVELDAVNGVARVDAGAWWQDVIDAVAPFGLTAMHGSAHDVGVVGYLLGGGLSWYARQHGFASDSVVAVELVNGVGELVRVDAEHDAELFWALRGGGGNFGVVTAVEIRLLPVADVYAGMMLWDVSHAPAVFATYAEWSPTAPDEVTASCRVMRFPPIPDLPPFLSGRDLVVLDAALLLDDEDAAAALAPFAALQPEMNTFARVPSSTLTQLHMDPPVPTPAVSDGVVLDRLDAAALSVLMQAFGPESGTDLFVAELRLLGGAVGRSRPDAGAMDALPGSHLLFFIQMAPVPEAVSAAHAVIDGVMDEISAVTSGRTFLNFSERGGDPRDAYDERTWARLLQIKQHSDPHGLFVSSHPLA